MPRVFPSILPTRDKDKPAMRTGEGYDPEEDAEDDEDEDGDFDG